MRGTGHVARMEEKRNAYRILVEKPEGKRPLGRPKRRWVVNIKMDRRETEWGGVVWIDLTRDKWRWLRNWRFLEKGSAPWSQSTQTHAHVYVRTVRASERLRCVLSSYETRATHLWQGKIPTFRHIQDKLLSFSDSVLREDSNS
jgi:hypothetical protein